LPFRTAEEGRESGKQSAEAPESGQRKRAGAGQQTSEGEIAEVMAGPTEVLSHAVSVPSPGPPISRGRSEFGKHSRAMALRASIIAPRR